MMKKAIHSFYAATLALSCLSLPAFAQSPGQTQEVLGHAVPWQIKPAASVTPVRDELLKLNSEVHMIIFAVVALVICLLGYVILRFNRKANPVPARFSHNVKLEFAWTVLPIIVLIVIAIPSLRTHYYMQKDVDADLTIKVTGRQWYWNYAYPDQGGIEFDSYIKKSPADPANPKPEELQPGELRLLEVDNHVVVPVNATVRVLLSGGDVIHSWAMPAFGVKRDAVPGRLNEAWFKATKTGTYYGQCSELCGTGHGFMPIAVDVVEQSQFNDWVAAKQKAAGITPTAATAPATPKEAPATQEKPESMQENKVPPNAPTISGNPQKDSASESKEH